MIPHPSSSESNNEVTFTNQANKRKRSERKEGQTSKQNQPENEEESQPGDALNLMFRYFGNKFNNMKSQLAENSRPPLYNFKRIWNKK